MTMPTDRKHSDHMSGPNVQAFQRCNVTDRVEASDLDKPLTAVGRDVEFVSVGSSRSACLSSPGNIGRPVGEVQRSFEARSVQRPVMVIADVRPFRSNVRVQSEVEGRPAGPSDGNRRMRVHGNLSFRLTAVVGLHHPG